MADLSSERIKQYFFRGGSLVAGVGGRFETFSDPKENINGELQSIVFLDNNYENIGSILIFASGLGNSGVGINSLLMKITAGSRNQVFYPFDYGTHYQGINGSPNIHIQRVIHSNIRIVGSGLVANKSGIGIIINYI